MSKSEMTKKQWAAYQEALRRIAMCMEKGKRGVSLDLNKLGLSELPSEIGQLAALEELRLHSNEINSLPPEIGHLGVLRKLWLFNNEFRSLPPEICQLSALTHLSLSSNQLRSVPPEIGQLKALEELYLHTNQLSSLPPEIWQLKALNQLYLHDNQLGRLPPEVGGLKRLTRFQLHNNQLSRLPPELGRLSMLRELDLHNNQLSSLPPEIGQLKELKQLGLSGNRLSSLPPTIGQLGMLTQLRLDDNQLKSLPSQIGELTELKELYLHGNPALGLPDSILGPTFSEAHNFDEKQRKLAARPADILNFYFSQQRAQVKGTARRVGEIKVMLVGRGGAGKTSLRRFFLGQAHDVKEPETPGIALDDFPLRCGGEEVRVRLWDFAGQEITHALHQFFLTEGCVYLLVLDPRSNTEMRDAIYWLELLKRYADGAPVVVALNRQDARHGGYDVDRRLLKERFPQIADFVLTNCETRFGCEDLRKALCRVIEGLPETQPPRLEVDQAWLAVKDECFAEREPQAEEKPGLMARMLRLAGHESADAKKAQGRQHLKLEEFREICAKHGETDGGKQESLARLLHQLGAVLHFADDARLRDTAVLNPHWVTDSVYKLLRHKEGDHSDGVLSLAEAGKALPGEDEKTVRYLLRLMERFEMCFPLDEEAEKAATRWLVPGALGKYLPEGVGKEWQEPGAVRLRYVYDPLPEGVIPRFIVLTQRLSEGEPRWRYGVVLRDGPAAALVRRGDKENQVEVAAFGPVGERLRLLEIIQGNLERINADVPDPAPYAELELAGVPGEYRRMADLEAAELNEQQVSVRTAEGVASVEPTPQLNLTTEPEARDPERVPLSLFLSYSHKDKGAKIIFQENLTVMAKKRLIGGWYDGLIEPDRQWREEIESKLYTTDIFVGLLTNAFIASDFFQDVEVAAARYKLDKDFGTNFLFVLILVDDIPLDGLDLLTYRLIKPGGKAVSKHANRKEGFTHAQRELETLIKDLQEGKRNRERILDGKHFIPKAVPHPSESIVEGVTYIVHGDFVASGGKQVRDDHSLRIEGDNYGQLGQTLAQCRNVIQQQAPGEVKRLLETLVEEVRGLIEKLPEEKREEVADDLKMLVETAASGKPNRKWYSVSAEGLIEASKFVQDFTGNIAGTVGKLRKVLGVG